jgi:hypothetical protein
MTPLDGRSFGVAHPEPPVNLFPAFHWLRGPANHDVITRWTAHEGDSTHTLVMPAAGDAERFEFLVLGDTGDSDVVRDGLSPQDAVARELAEEASLPHRKGRGRLVLHLGDVVYMTGERRLYDRNFRRPYAAFLTPDSTYERLVFRLPFLPVPGNHDYYDFPVWAGWLARAPLLGAGFREIARELFAFSIPRGGSDMGRAFMEAFVDGAAPGPRAYLPGRDTRLPNRYYRLHYGGVDFFALDSNTLDGVPSTVEESGVRRDAARTVAGLDTLARETDAEIRREQRALAEWRRGARRDLARSPDRREQALEAARNVTRAHARLGDALRPPAESGDRGAKAARAGLEKARVAWLRELPRLAAAPPAGAALSRSARAAGGDERKVLRALAALDRAHTRTHEAQRTVEECLVRLPDGELRRAALAARADVAAALERWSTATADTPPSERSARVAQLSEAALEIQRKLARETRRLHYRSDDYDVDQLRWLDQALAESVRERPRNWRVVYLHHPLVTSIRSYCESPEIQEIRENLIGCLRGRVHAVFSGHAHAFEWLRCDALPDTGLFVSGGGGQIALGRSVLDPRRGERFARRIRALSEAGVTEVVNAGRGPRATDGTPGALYHFLRVEVTPEAIRVCPVGVRRTRLGYRRETPMPVHHARLAAGARMWHTRLLESVEVRRGVAPEARWG